MKTIYTARAPEPGNYVQAVLIDPAKYYLLELSGQTATKDEIATIATNQMYFQTFHALEHLLVVVEEAGGDIHSFAKLDVYLKDSGSPEEKESVWRSFNTAYADFFHKYGRKEFPARATFFVVDVPSPSENTIIEITGFAAIPKPEKLSAPRKKETK